MAKLLKFLQLLLLIAPILAKELNIEFIKLDIKPKKNEVADIKFNVVKSGSTVFKISGKFQQLNSMGNEYKIQATLFYASEPNHYTQLTYLPKLGVCEIMQGIYKTKIYDKLMKACKNAPNPDQCPVPPAKYEVTNYHWDIADYKGFLVEGYYKFEVAVYKGNSLKLTVSAFVEAN